MYLEPHLFTYHTNIGVQSATVLDLGMSYLCVPIVGTSNSTYKFDCWISESKNSLY